MTGPFTKTIEIQGKPYSTGYVPKWVYKYQRWFRQRPPYKGPLPYTLIKRLVVSSNGNSEYSLSPPYDPSSQTAALNKCRSKFVEEGQNSAQWLVNLAQARQAEEMMVKRLGQLTRFARALARLDFRGASRVLSAGKNSSVPRNLRRDAKSFGSNFLEYRFGWEPLVKDIGLSIEILKREFDPVKPVKARGKDFTDSGTKVLTSNDHDYVTERTVTRSYCQMGARLAVTDPTLLLLNQLGFDNPATVALELIPYSFVFGWFANLSQVLNSWSDFRGTAILDGYTTYYQVIDRFDHDVRFKGYPPDNETYNISAHFRSVYLDRTSGIADPVFQFRRFTGFSPVRGATAVALLLQHLKAPRGGS